MFDLLKHTLTYFPREIALSQDGYELSYLDVFKEVRKMRKKLQFLGLISSDRIALYHPNDFRSVILLLACLYEGIELFLLNTRLPYFFVERALSSLNVKWTISSEKCFPRSLSFSELFSLHPKIFLQEKPIDEEKPFTLMYTSGSSGSPKVAVHSYRNHLRSAMGANLNLPLEPKKRWLLTLPLFHVGGLGVIFRSFLQGASVVMSQDLSLEEQITKNHITHVSLVPTQLLRLIQKAKSFSSLEAVLVGGAKTSHSLYEQASSLLPIYLTYGLTEMSSQVFTPKTLYWKNHLPYGGFPLPFRRAKVKNQELYVQGDTLFLGYLKNQKIENPLDKEGFFATKDLCSFDPEFGFLIQGRRDRLFISGGENIQPEEIEHALLRLQGIRSAKVLPVPHPEYGSRPFAFIEHEREKFEEKALRDSLKETLPSYKIPDRILPLTDASKYDKKH